MARTLTPERQKLKREALSLRYDYGWDIRRIAGHLHVPKTVIHRFVSHNTNGRVSHNSTAFTHLEGDCLARLKDIPDNNSIFEHWLAGETIEDLAKSSHLTDRHIKNVTKRGKANKNEDISPTEQPPPYNVWNYGKCDPRFGQFGGFMDFGKVAENHKLCKFSFNTRGNNDKAS